MRLAGDATVRTTITADGEHVFSVYNFLDLACPNSKSYSSVIWSRLISEDSEFKDEIEFTMVYLKLQNEGLSNTKKRRFRKTPAWKRVKVPSTILRKSEATLPSNIIRSLCNPHRVMTGYEPTDKSTIHIKSFFMKSVTYANLMSHFQVSPDLDKSFSSLSRLG